MTARYALLRTRSNLNQQAAYTLLLSKACDMIAHFVANVQSNPVKTSAAFKSPNVIVRFTDPLTANYHSIHVLCEQIGMVLVRFLCTCPCIV
jgi:hypothetical protein